MYKICTCVIVFLSITDNDNVDVLKMQLQLQLTFLQTSVPFSPRLGTHMRSKLIIYLTIFIINFPFARVQAVAYTFHPKYQLHVNPEDRKLEGMCVLYV